jgi:energy-coupling factor transporter ATP-binding protein EcfA2
MKKKSPNDLEQAVLAAALESEFEIKPISTPAELFEAKLPCFLMRTGNQTFRFGSYLDLQPAMLVYNPLSRGTLGLVTALAPNAKNFREAARNAIEEGVQVRQIFLEDSQRKQLHALQVEVVLLLPPNLSDDAKNELAEELNDIARRTGYLRLIGLNVLALAEPGKINRAELRRAFCWLLHETRQWFKHICDGTNKKAAQSWCLELDHYRLQGRRRFQFAAGGHRLHLVHGHNGSGKSSLVEALELLLTQQIERLDEGGETVYFSAIGFRGAGFNGPACNAAHAILTLDGSESRWECTINQSGQTFTTPNSTGGFRSQSFRIDQRFMNDLVRADQCERAKLFVKAFAPDETKVLDEVQDREKAFQAAWDKLAPGLKPSDTSMDLAGRLNWTINQLAVLVSSGAAVTPAESSVSSGGTLEALGDFLSLERLLPVAASDLILLAQIRKSLTEHLEILRAQPLPSALGAIDEELKAFLDGLPHALEDLRTTVRVMEEFADWKAAGQIVRGITFEDDLQRWMELKALADLSAKYLDIVASLQRATELGWQPSPIDAPALPPLPHGLDMVEQVQARKNELVRELNDASQRLRSWQSLDSPPDKQADEKPVQVRRFLRPDEERALDAAGAWLPSAEAPESLGKLFRSALSSDQAQTLKDGSVGYRGGLKKPIEEGKALIGACVVKGSRKPQRRDG